MMTNNLKLYPTIAIIAIGCIFLTGLVGAAAPISTINPGNMVFIGEQGLDITAAMQGDNQLGWWASGAAVSTSSPDQLVNVPNPGSYSISPSTFGGYTGTWYHLSSPTKANGSAFTVVDPQLDLRVEDTTVNVDVTNKWVPTGDDIRFRIGTNLAAITQRGVASVPITIKVQSPSGGIYSALANSAGTAVPITDIPVNTNDYYTASIWNTGARDLYPPGTYAIWAECNVNSMKDNYGQSGKTISSQVSLLDQDKNPLISNKGYVTNPTTPVATIITTSQPTTIVTTMSTPAPVVTTSAPVTTVTTVSQATTIETTPVPLSTTIPVATKSPGFGGDIAVLAGIAAIAICLKRS